MAYITDTRCRPLRPARTLSLLGFLDLYRQRRALARLDESQLKDIGISPNAAKLEAERHFWDAPNSWRR